MPDSERINAVLEHGQYIMGPEVKELEVRLANYTGSKHCITVASGTEALLISLMALGIKPGDDNYYAIHICRDSRDDRSSRGQACIRRY